jgi:hypothetical protein
MASTYLPRGLLGILASSLAACAADPGVTGVVQALEDPCGCVGASCCSGAGECVADPSGALACDCDDEHLGRYCELRMVRRFHYDAHGNAHGANALGPGAYLFEVALPAEDGDDTLLAAFKAWVVDHAEEIGFSPGLTVAHLAGLVVSDVASSRNVDSRTFTFEQTHEGLPIDGPARWVRLRVADDFRVEAWEGELVDRRRAFRRGRPYLTLRDARTAIATAWRDAGHGEIAELDRIERRASLAYETHVYRAVVLGTAINGARPELGVVAIDAFTGAPRVVQLRAAHDAAEVSAPEMVDDPHTATLATYEVPTTTFGPTVYLGMGCEPPAAGRDYRLGDALRLATWNFAGTYDDPHELLAQGCTDGNPPPAFDAAGGEGLNAQTMHVVVKRMLDHIDPLMGEMWTHGSAHAYSWDHHESTPAIAHRAPLVVFTNRGEEAPNVNGCGGDNGVFEVWKLPEVVMDLEAPMPSPLLYGADGEYHLPVVNACNHAVGSMMHEIGHYYDAYNSFGTSGDDGEDYAVCCLDRPHEAATMRETIGQLFSLYGYRRLYPDLSYTLDTTPAPCSFSGLQGYLPRIVHQDCIEVNAQFKVLNDKRPTGDEAPWGCKLGGPNGGYAVEAITQAYWELLFGVWCEGTGTDVSCDAGVADAGYADRWMEALLAALDMGNGQSFVQLWDNIGAFIQTNYPADYALFDHVRELHGIVPLVHGLDPDCACPQLDGTCTP